MSDEFDIEQHDQLIAYLRAIGRIARDETPLCKTLAGGVSNRTVWLKRASGEEWVLKQALAKLRVKVDWFSDPSRVHREALGLKWLEKLAPPGTITPLVFEDEAKHLLAMQAVGQPHENWKTMLLRGEVDLARVEQFAQILWKIHAAAHMQSDVLEPIFADRSFFESLRLEPYYAYTATQVPEAREFLEHLIRKTRDRRMTLVHGDYSPKNILVHRGQLVLLDHEVIHWGDPSFDVGFALAHFLSKAHHLREHRVKFIGAAHAFARAYAQLQAIQPWVVEQTLGCMLGRVAGRSTLEYLDDDERQRQQRIVVEIMKNPPRLIAELMDLFSREFDAKN